jgi:hypothetical protein
MTRSWQRWAWTLVLLSCACCALPGCIFGGQTGQDSSAREAPGCDGSSPVGDDEINVLGFSANQAVAALQGPVSGQLAWLESGKLARLTVSLQYPGNNAQLVSVSCASHLRLQVLARIVSDDGLLDESALATLEVSAPDRAQLTADIAIGSLRGTYDDQRPARGELHVALQLQDGQLSGLLLLLDRNDASDVETTVGDVTP